ncbi:MAG: MEMO1 family protein [Candidatus Poribacteria bacterium]|nr:MAG: MEMO1 family protein [Candidatus Poribacteria bacterium]
MRSAPYDRPPAVAGQFYPDDPEQLRRMVDRFLSAVPEQPLQGAMEGIIVPHAGYIYSGPVAAHAFARLKGKQYDSVVMLGPSHYYRFPGAAVHGRGSFRTPLGSVPVDEELAAELIAFDPQTFHDNPAVHVPEHDLEVQLPFLQRILPPFRIVPILQSDFSEENCRRIADGLTRVLEGKNALLLVTTDLAHYPAYQDAVRSDQAMIEAIVSFDPQEVRRREAEFLAQAIPNLHVTMCGTGPVISGIYTAKNLGADGFQPLKYANSGDVPGGSKYQVVGYVSGAFYDTHAPASGR